MVVLGIDPGVAPALALYGGPECCPMVWPPLGAKRDGKRKIVDGEAKIGKITDPDEAAILSVFTTYRPAIAAIELVGPMPGEGVSSVFRFGDAVGLVRGIALGQSCRVARVRPNEWQRAFKMPVGDDVSRQVCARLFPWMADKFALKKNHNEADSLLIAVYVWCREMGVPVPVV